MPVLPKEFQQNILRNTKQKKKANIIIGKIHFIKSFLKIMKSSRNVIGISYSIKFVKELIHLIFSKATQRDDIEELQEISSQHNFNFVQMIPPSLF